MPTSTTLDQIFTYYDKIIGNLPPYYQALISLGLIAFLIWNIHAIIKSGHWALIALLIIMLPSTWPALRFIGTFIWALFNGLFLRASGI